MADWIFADWNFSRIPQIAREPANIKILKLKIFIKTEIEKKQDCNSRKTTIKFRIKLSQKNLEK